MTRTRKRSGRRGEVLATVAEAAGGVGIAEIAEQLGIHPNTARFHLENLAADELIERIEHRPRGVGRPPARYCAAPHASHGAQRDYRVLAEVLLSSLENQPNPTARAIEAGREWGRREAPSSPGEGTSVPAAPAGALTSVLERVGFAPEQPEGEEQTKVFMRNCPFRELAVAHHPTVCAVHLGLMRGVLEGLSSPMTTDRIDPLVRPDLCVAYLSAP